MSCARMGCTVSQCDSDGTFLPRQTSDGSCKCVERERGIVLISNCDRYTDCESKQPSGYSQVYNYGGHLHLDICTLALWAFMHLLASIFIWSPVLAGAYVAVFSAIKNNTSICFRDFFSGFSCRYYCKLLALTFVLKFLQSIFFLLLVLPGIWWSLATMFALPLHKEHSFLGVCGSIRLSLQVINRHFCSMLGFLIILVLLQVLGFLCLIVGMLYTMPLAFVALCYCYHDLIGIVTEAPFAGPVDVPVTVHV